MQGACRSSAVGFVRRSSFVDHRPSFGFVYRLTIFLLFPTGCWADVFFARILVSARIVTPRCSSPAARTRQLLRICPNESTAYVHIARTAVVVPPAPALLHLLCSYLRIYQVLHTRYDTTPPAVPGTFVQPFALGLFVYMGVNDTCCSSSTSL